MTNNVEEDEQSHNCVATVAALDLVKEVLDDAFLIANAARESGRPWRYLSMIKSLQYNYPMEMEDTIVADDKSILMTSTPQRYTENPKNMKIVCQPLDFIGQGDIYVDKETSLANDKLICQSIIINDNNSLLDMSEVEKESQICKPVLEARKTHDENTKEIEQYADKAIHNSIIEENKIDILSIEKSLSTAANYSKYSFISDALANEIVTDVTIYTDTESRDMNKVSSSLQTVEKLDCKFNETKEIPEPPFFANAYLTLNLFYKGDDEQDSRCGDDDEELTFQDKKTSFHEIHLLTGNSSQEKLAEIVDLTKEKCMTTSSSAGSHKNTLARCCRTRGARLLSCLRGWWRRRTTKKTEIYEVETCNNPRPLSPTLQNQHRVNEDIPEKCMLWKFNTINEALRDSLHWKDYTFEVNNEHITNV